MQLNRIIFAIYQYINGKQLGISEYGKSLIYGFYMDMSIGAALLMILLLTTLLTNLFSLGTPVRWMNYFTIGILVLISVIYSVDSVLYNEWGFRIDQSIFLYLKNTNEAIHFIQVKNVFHFLLITLVTGWAFFYISKFVLQWKVVKKLNLKFSNNIFLLLGILLCIIPLRGGIGLAPLNPATVYHSQNLFANHLSLNPVWNILYTYFQNKKTEEYYPSIDSRSIEEFNTAYPESNDLSFRFMDSTHPNVLIIMLESFTSSFVNSFHKSKEITPELNRWIKTGLYFNNAYASGDRTDKGLPAILSGYPAQPLTSIIKFSKKSDQLPALSKTFGKMGYSTHFYYGGDITFAGMKSYLLSSGFQHILDKSEFPSSSYNAKWGVHDHILFEKLFQDIQRIPSPFFITTLTLSSHPPFDIPEENYWPENDYESLFANSAHYTDKYLGKFLDELKKSRYWENLLVICVADHGARFPETIEYFSKTKFHIPLLITGGVVKVDSMIQTTCSQIDIASTVLNQINTAHKEFIFSRNIFSKDRIPFAFYAYNNGIAWVKDSCHLVISNDNGNIIEQDGSCSEQEKFCKTYLELLLDDFSRK